ncbi:MAG: hypothetical protein RLZZ563_1778 [Pseudomonadota bacterium]|jgi:3-oxoacyl-[acyl-carrier protein] reductase
MQLSGKTALVTGASGGIGSEIARHLARSGAKVAVHYASNASAADAVVGEIRAAGGDAIALAADLRDVGAIRGMFAAIKAAFGRLDILVNNAGIAVQMPIAAIDEATYDALWAINTKAYFFCMQEAGALMPACGRIINIGSGIAYSNRPGSSLYAASRAAIQSFVRVAAMEFGPRGITVNSVSPGPVSPGVYDQLPVAMQEMVRSMSPFGRVGTPGDIAGIVAFLASDAASWISGQDILATGGARP